MAVAAGGLGSALLMTFVAGAFGLPARRVSLLRSRSGATPRVTRRHARTALVVAQVAIALVLLAGAGLFARSLSAALAVNPGFDAQHLVTGRMALFDSGYSRPAADAFFDELRQRLAVNASVRAFSISASHGGMTPRGQLVVDGQPRRFPSMVYYMAVDDRYFSTIGLEVIQGRDFSRDDRADGPPVAIVSESLGRLLADGADPIGHRIGSPSERNTPRVVGVVPDIITDVTTLEPLVLYHPLIQRPAVAWRAVAIRPAGDPEAAIREVHATIRQMDARVPPPPLRTMEDGLAAQMGPQRFGATVLGGLGGIAALLTLLGTYVVAATVAGARRREMGIRAALGARPRQLSGLVFAETARLAGLGIAAGLFLAWLGAGSIRPFLFRTPPLDQVTLGAVAGGMLLLALAVSLRPALSAARVNLVSVLRDE
jgi:putative ABC transport system permease protein